MIPRFPKSVEDLALEASQACVEMIQNEGNERVRIDIKGVEKFGGGREFNRLIGQFIALLSQRGTGFKKIRVVFATEGLAAAAGPHLRPLPGGAALQSAVLDDDAPLGREVDGGGGGGNDDAGGAGLLVLVRPSNNAYAGGNWENMDRVQRLVLESGAAGVPVLMVNPELRNYMGHPPMLLDDFAPAFFFDRHYYLVDPYTAAGVVRRYPRKWELFLVDLRQQGSYVFFKEFEKLPTPGQISDALEDRL